MRSYEFCFDSAIPSRSLQGLVLAAFHLSQTPPEKAGMSVLTMNQLFVYATTCRTMNVECDNIPFFI